MITKVHFYLQVFANQNDLRDQNMKAMEKPSVQIPLFCQNLIGNLCSDEKFHSRSKEASKIFHARWNK